MLAKIILGLFLAMQTGAGSHKAFIPTSDAISVAEKVAKGEGILLLIGRSFSST